MTHDSSTLSSLRSLDSPVHVRTADGTSLPVHGRDTLSTSSFTVPDVAHVPRLTMQLIFGGQIVDSGCRLILDFDSCSFVDRRTGDLLVQVPVAVTLRVFGSLTGFIFLPLLPLPVPLPLLPYLPALFSSGITELVTYVALVSPL